MIYSITKVRRLLYLVIHPQLSTILPYVFERGLAVIELRKSSTCKEDTRCVSYRRLFVFYVDRNGGSSRLDNTPASVATPVQLLRVQVATEAWAEPISPAVVDALPWRAFRRGLRFFGLP